MTPEQDLAAMARAIIEANSYMTLGTADADGLPWVSPVWFAAASYAELLWVSSPEARHSRNLAMRPQLSIVIFDSRQPEGTGEGVYMSAVAEQLTGPELDGGIATFSRRSQENGGAEWTVDDVARPPAIASTARPRTSSSCSATGIGANG
jgi:hypothetical protein